MTASFPRPARRIALALALSLLAHTGILFLPYPHLSHRQIDLPPLTVRLQPGRKPEPKIDERPQLAAREPPLPVNKAHEGASTPISHRALGKLAPSDLNAAPQPFPPRLVLTFIEYTDEESLRSGEIRHQLDTHTGRYSLKAERKPIGPAALVNNDRLVQTSIGKLNEHGLQPEDYREARTTSAGRVVLQATFDHQTSKLKLSDGSDAVLPPDSQDALSFLYQLSQIPLRQEYIPLDITDGTQLKQYQIEIGVKEELKTPMGTLQALHLRQMHSDGEGYFELWLGLGYRMLPVKYRLVDASGKTIKEFVVSDIRVSNE